MKKQASGKLKKHCQRHNGGLSALTKVTSLGSITSSNTNLDQFSASKYRPTIRPVHKNIFLEFPKMPGSFMLHFDK